MELSVAGIFGGIAVGCALFGVVYFVCKSKEIKAKLIYLIYGAAALVTVGLSLLGGYLGRTELIEGDYSHESCDYIGCGDPSSYEFYYNFSKNYYCEHHSDYCRMLTGEIKTTGAGKDSFGHDDSDAWSAAVSVVSGKLKSPSTAEFCSKSSATIKKVGDTWTVSGYVDAQNSFGATLRNDFTVKITFTSSTKYNIEQCDITAR